jgi:hypothetical protein
MLTRFIVAAVLVTASMTIALAAPARIIILRHGEKANKWKLCDTGEQRANALAANYLGRGAAKSLFASGDEPAFFFAIALHTLELALASGRELEQAGHPLFRGARGGPRQGHSDQRAQPAHAWIVDFPANSNVPSRFSMVKQEFGAPYAGVPSNDWDAPNGLEDASGCEIKDD